MHIIRQNKNADYMLVTKLACYKDYKTEGMSGIDVWMYEPYRKKYKG